MAHAVLTPPAPARTLCDRETLERIMRACLGALMSGNVQGAPLASSIKYTENQTLLATGAGLWAAKLTLGDYFFLSSDIRNQQIAYMGNAQVDDAWTMIAVRLRVIDGTVTEMEVIAPGAAAGAGVYDLSAGAGGLDKARPAFSTDLRPDERRDRWQIIQAADLHYEGIERGNGDIVPFGNDCIKIENGVQLILNPDFQSPGVSPSGRPVPNYTAYSARDQFNTHIWDTDTITDRRYPVVDEERGVAIAFAQYNQYIKGPCAITVDHGPVLSPEPVAPYSLAIAEAFKVRAGFIEEVESIFTVLPQLRTRGVW